MKLSKKLIDEFEYIALNTLADMMRGNYEGTVSDEQIFEYATELKNQWEQKNYIKDGTHGKVLAYTLSITLASLEWWRENPDASYKLDSIGNKVLVAPWVAADVGGAIWGGATGAIASYVGTGEVNGWAVGIGALSGAVSTSTGAAGKLGKWLFGK